MTEGAAPFFDLGGGGLALALTRGIALAAVLSAFGCLFFLVAMAPPALARMTVPERMTVVWRCLRLARVSLCFAVLAEVAWLVLESAVMAGTGSVSRALAAVPTVARDTEFGHLVVAQMVLLAAAGVVTWGGDPGRRVTLAVVLTGLTATLQAWHLHAAAMFPGFSALLGAEVLHVVAAGAWLGSLLPLALLIGAAPPEAGSIASRRYSPFGASCVSVLTTTAFWQVLVLAGGVHGLIATAYGWMILVKLALFAVLIGFAWRNRFRVTPRLSGTDSLRARVALQHSIASEAGIGLLVVLAASVLASLPPAMDMTMPPAPMQQPNITSIDLPGAHR
jgi:putative copper resistance protein D